MLLLFWFKQKKSTQSSTEELILPPQPIVCGWHMVHYWNTFDDGFSGSFREFTSSSIWSQRVKFSSGTTCFAGRRTVCRSGSEVGLMSKLEHSVATHCKWALMRFPAFIFCTVRQPYGSAAMSDAPAGANILQPPWWHCHQSFTYTQVIARSGHMHICV